MPSDDDKDGGSFGGNAILVGITVAFLLGFVPVAIATFAPLVKSIDARNWAPGKATIESSFVNSKDRQYWIEARYRYTWEGSVHVSDRIFFDESVGLRRTYYHALNRELLKHKDPARPIPIWIDPTAPDQSVVYRYVRWDKFAASLMFLLLYSLITLGLAGACIAQFRNS